ncbi:MAG: DUF4422 domain-containing protein [Alphaproteobacteria bacterium]|nr:DUF4422 domain-containing protein [Alphaproteobacteria bacterium]
MNKNQDNIRPKVKILVAYHKPFSLLKDDIFVPVHGGRAVAEEKSKDGSASQKDLKWLKNNTIGDNVGDNISNLNRFLNEMTVVYWAWKNQKTIGNPDFIGLTHYRRHFILDDADNYSDKQWLPESSVYVYEKINDKYKNLVGDPDKLTNLLKKYDIICSHKYDANNLNDGHTYKSCKERFIVVSKSKGIWYDKMSNIIKKDFPEYKEELDYLNKHASHYLCNMFIMRKDVFDQYCRFVFHILLKLFEEFKKEKHADVWSSRALGFLAEFLTSIFIQKYKKTHKAKVKELCLTYLKDEKEICTTVKLLDFIPILKRLQCGGKIVYKVFGLPIWKIRHMENNITTKYYFLGIPLIKISKK